MSVKYYTQFILTDADYRDGNEFCGVVELNHPMEQTDNRSDIEAILAVFPLTFPASAGIFLSAVYATMPAL
jgi:hypothetical protein